MNALEKAARIAVRECLAVKKGETALVITDEPLLKIGRLLWEACRQAGSEAILMEIIPRKTSGEEPPPAVAAFMKKADVLLIPTSKSLSHTKARREACRARARCATLPGITEDTMRRALNANYQKIAQLSLKIAHMLTKGSVAHVTNPAGTDIRMSLKGRKGHPDTGLVHKPGDFSNLPAGEAYMAPVEGSAQGIIVIDGCIGETGVLRKPITMQVNDGLVTKIAGGAQAQILLRAIKGLGKLARNIAELGIGTNDRARVVGSPLEDEKVMGTVHIAMGDNASMGGKVSVASHLDAILLKPTLVIDDQIIIKKGHLVV
ncbi:MAG: leucyl aminopeptidase [candidate division Zixibacteria bacterium SM23_81]|nr:MAG: leucyl aminopeptidase [candidate division Zixibacteria bacterium SM23_81]